MRNEAIKAALKQNAVYQWEVAELLGIPETAFSRKLRHELPEADKASILKAIEKITAERGV
ncbi:MAG: hypothetical protein SPG80_11195 [Candidatus Ventricola sp.]|nr:hypothetical protein [Candidatus Ventricola sp.]